MKWKKFPGYKEVEMQLDFLCAGADVQERTKNYYKEKMGLLLKVFLAGIAVSLVLLIHSRMEQTLVDGRFLTRKEQKVFEELELWVEGEEVRSIQVEVEPRQPDRGECRELLEEVVDRLDEWILGENASLDEVRHDLNLLTEVEDKPVSIAWELDSYEAMNHDGSLREENLTEEGTLVTLTAHLTCYEEATVYRRVVRVLPPLLEKEDRFDRELQEAMAEAQEKSKVRGQMSLPEEAAGKALVWREKPSRMFAAVIVITLICLPVLYVAKDLDLKQQLKVREEQMKRDYARIVSKLVLLMGAGTTIRNAWEQVVRDYKAGVEQGKYEPRYAYEEMALAVRELQNGLAESQVYERFGQRCRVSCYLKMSALLEQNLKKGNEGLTAMLQMEVQEAFEQRKELARRKGEEASTKMLLPLMLLLLLIMILVMAPAMMSMQV